MPCSGLAVVVLLQLLPLDRAASADEGGVQASRPDSHLSKYGTQICTGMAEAFLHKENLSDGEMDCLVSNLGNVAFGAYEYSENVAQLLTKAVDGGHAGGVGPGAQVVLELAKSLHGLVHFMDGVMTNCVHGRALQLLVKAGEHLRNLTYVTGRFIANGADIVEEISDAIGAFQSNSYHRFGHDIGTACRKVLLSNSSVEVLPEGPPSPQQLVNASAGFVQGFFGEGFELDISSDKRVATASTMHTIEFIEAKDDQKGGVQPQDGKPLNIHIDLHTCVARNLALFQAVLGKAWFYFAEATVQPSGHRTRGFFAFMLQGVPGALARCGINPEQQLMLMDSLQALHHLRLRLTLPGGGAATAQAAAEDLRRAAESWSQMSWFAFGEDLGRMLQGLAVQAFPHKYVRTNAGSLRNMVSHAADRVAEGAHEELAKMQPLTVSKAELARGGFTSPDDLGVGTGLSKNGVQIVTGMAEGFLHRGNLSQSEMECLMKSVGNVLGGAWETAHSFFTIFKELSVGTSMHVSPMLDLDEIMLQFTRSSDSVVRLMEGFMAQCADSSAVRALEKAAEHLQSLRYVTGRLVANGAEVEREIDAAAADFKRHDSHAFGLDVGRLCRKVLLSSASAPELPEGDLTLPQIVNMSAGMLEGFFGKGFELDVTSTKKLAAMPAMSLETLLADDGAASQKPVAKRLDLHIDLHTCVKRNLPLFQSVLAVVTRLFAVQDAAPVPNVQALGMMVLGELPKALKRCGVDSEEEQMLMEAVEALDQLRLRVRMPHGTELSIDHAAEVLKQAVKDWSQLRWFALGKDLGQMLREAVVTAYSGLYTVDNTGRLRRQLLGLSAVSKEAASHRFATAAPLLLSCALLVAMAVAIMRGSPMMRCRTGNKHDTTRSDTEEEDFEAAMVCPRALE